MPPIDNPLLLGPPIVLLAAGITSAPPAIQTRCNQGLAVYTLTIPSGAPTGLTFRVQSVGVSNSGPVGLGPAIEFTIC